MRFLVIVPFLLLFWSNRARSQQCTEQEWTSTFAIASESMSQCENNVSYVNGLRSAGYGALTENGPGVIKAARCCAVKLPYSQEGNDCYWDEWWTVLTSHDSWATCKRKGYLFHGFFTVGRNFLADIGMGQCCKPSSHPDEDGFCTDVNVDFKADGTKQCPGDMFMKGIYKTKCSTIDCLTRIKCCRMVPGRVDGGWAEWGDWGDCPVKCGGGIQIRIRTCTNPPPSAQGNDCAGLPFQRQRCNQDACPENVDGGWAEWGDWSDCPVSCGGGIQNRIRTCTNPPKSGQGNDCVGVPVQTQPCNQDACPGAVDGGLSDWSQWGTCTVTCSGGNQQRRRTCTNPPPSNGGAKCSGYRTESQECNKNPCEPA